MFTFIKRDRHWRLLREWCPNLSWCVQVMFVMKVLKEHDSWTWPLGRYNPSFSLAYLIIFLVVRFWKKWLVKKMALSLYSLVIYRLIKINCKVWNMQYITDSYFKTNWDVSLSYNSCWRFIYNFFIFLLLGEDLKV